MFQSLVNMFFVYVAAAIGFSWVIYFGQGGLLHLVYYVRRRGQADQWKCQPQRFLSPELARHAVLLGAANVALGGLISGSLAYHAFNGGWTQLYFDLGTHGLAYTLFSTALVAVATDAGAYYAHRLYHRPALFKRIHVWH